MSKYIKYTILLFLCYCQSAYGQNKFNVQLAFGDKITPQDIQVSYYNGENTLFLPDTLTNHFFTLSDNYYSKFPSLSVLYQNKNDSIFSFKDFFLTGNASEISFYITANKELRYNKIINAKPIFDSTNEIYREISSNRRNAALAVNKFRQKYSQEIGKDTLLTQYYHGLLKSVYEKDISVIKKYPKDYFSFWYFRDQIVTPSVILFSRDTAYLRGLKNFILTVFPNEYVKGVEGKSLLNTLNSHLRPPGSYKNTPAPGFSIKDINGHIINLKSYREKYVLLDFWATWCGPCMQALPFIKKIREEYPEGKLAILGISWDRDTTRLRQVVHQKQMNWLQVLDRNNKVSRLYGIHAIPETVLIDKEGKIVFNGGPGEQNKQILIDILKNM